MKPPVSSISGATPPFTRTLPSSGSRTPAMSLSSVLLPCPLPPTRPTASPGPTEKDTLRRAQKVPRGLVEWPLKTISRRDRR